MVLIKLFTQMSASRIQLRSRLLSNVATVAPLVYVAVAFGVLREVFKDRNGSLSLSPSKQRAGARTFPQPRRKMKSK